MVRILLDTEFRYGGQSTVRRGNSMYRCVVREGEVRVGWCLLVVREGEVVVLRIRTDRADAGRVYGCEL